VKIALFEPFMTGSHADWARGYAKYSRHQVRIYALEGKHWKWRMHGGAVTLAHEFLESGFRPDMILATDMLDLSTFLALTRKVTAQLPCAVYFHENQLSYPWSPDDADPGLKRDAHYCFINYTSALAADAVCFNSEYHRHDFLARLPEFLASFPDHREDRNAAEIARRSITLPLGMDFSILDKYPDRSTDDVNTGAETDVPLIVWNHRWEYDKNPEDFFHALFSLQDLGVAFNVAVLGEAYQRQPPIFAQARERLASHIVHWGYVKCYADYVGWLHRADIIPVTSVHDFFGVSVVEALYCGCYPLLPQRLAYPEHIPASLSAECFYADLDDLIRRLAHLCRSVPAQHLTSIREQVGRYSWEKMAPRYDEFFSRLKNVRR